MDVSREIVGVIAADKPRFADETAALLRRRLKAVASIMFVALAAAFVGNFYLQNVRLVEFRAAVLLVLAASYFVLRSGVPLSLLQLRSFELANFGLVAAQLLLMMYLRAKAFAGDGDVPSAVAAVYLFLSAWSILILTYGIFMPNNWKRATFILFPGACLPYLVLAILRWRVLEAADALNASNMVSPVPLPFVAALVAVSGTHIINSVRREAFRARQLGQYYLKQELGVGGMGVVYEAEHCMLKRPCAIKLIKPENEADSISLARFEREVRSIAKLSHWNTVEIYDYGHAEDGTFFYVMELLPGLSLEDLIKRHGPMPAARAVRFLRQTCCALREAHAFGLIHRDIKPANIFAAYRGGIYDVAKLLDFGLVKQAAGDSAAGHTEKPRKGFSGSPAYMAPEQSIDYDETDARGDIYSLGAVAYFLLTGRPPFSGKNAFEVFRAHHTRAVVPPSELAKSVPADVEQVLLRCLAKAAVERHQTAEALEQALSRCECANAWTDQQAAEWWSMHEPQQGAGRVATGSAAGQTEGSIDATIDT